IHYYAEEGKIIYNSNDINHIIEVGAENLAGIVYDEPIPMKHPNGDIQKSGIPFIVIWLVFGALFFTIRMRFINARGVGHAIDLIRGKYDKKEDEGEV